MKLLIFSICCLTTEIAPDTEQFQFILPEKLSANLADYTVYDANSQKVRQEYGYIAVATMLSDSSDFDERILPKDKNRKLAFYCFNELCRASHNAANRAIKLGYKNVFVLKNGILGWKKSGLLVKGI